MGRDRDGFKAALEPGVVAPDRIEQSPRATGLNCAGARQDRSAPPQFGTSPPCLRLQDRVADKKRGKEMPTPQQSKQHPDIGEAYVGPLASVPSLGFAPRRKASKGSDAWRETVTKHMPETWPAAHRSLQARIAALDIEA
jgi:hypothetical protein